MLQLASPSPPPTQCPVRKRSSSPISNEKKKQKIPRDYSTEKIRPSRITPHTQSPLSQSLTSRTTHTKEEEENPQEQTRYAVSPSLHTVAGHPMS
ncbi:unnamed protein product [Periconia digitata]|uniref:Uncharacterized protein n=1 Tax=Periconia digitata TaxID=1303443 RepID=A0A9W4U4H8_9PLEO|nr:unnamed protein product [Periconia digitata]